MASLMNHNASTLVSRLFDYLAFCGICCRHTEHVRFTCTVCGT